ncbi:alpha/beta hydrolase [Roseomonas sp. M0104]|uniref:Alpha/beta hydrolase n=1 Tax=Teichococcus coralli TaxID=2545983 RepID=A0A845B9H7_9PROT|nr:alpha/beta hydrolase [Pseudoroseomonas coralli]MXP63228.1 alpha/beta hydrolase [Pseudoroseomonas coralli]
MSATPAGTPQGRPASALIRRVVARSAAERTAQWAADSAALRIARPGKLDLPYASGEHRLWDLFPAVSPVAPCLVLLPGGPWGAGGHRTWGTLARGLLAHGWAAALPGHSPVPGASLTRIVRELHRALDWLNTQGPLHGVAGPVLVCGWGAGALLAALLLDHPRVAAGLGISGLYDLAPVEERLELSPLEVEALSPLRLPVVRKPLALAFGETEPPERQRSSRALHMLRQKEGGVGPLLPLPGLDEAGALEALEAPDGLLCHTACALIEEA